MPKFRVSGSNSQSGARMTLELTAATPADAEQRASQSGMVVDHASPMKDDTLEELNTPMALKNYRDEPAGGANRKLLIIFVILLVVFLFTGLVWPGFWR